jgi:flagellar hook protein FlgE
MMMIQGFYTGVSGMLSHQKGIDTLANNVTNINTPGFKGNEVEFKTIFDNNLVNTGKPYANSVGIGTTVSATTADMSQGEMLISDHPFDFALMDEGWFGIENGPDTLFTRSGTFRKDSDGFLVDPEGHYLLGTSGNNLTPTSSLTPEEIEELGQYYNLPNLNNPPQAYDVDPLLGVELTGVEAQTPIQLPDFLIYPPNGTANVQFHANLDPTIDIDLTNVALVDSDYTSTVNVANETLTMVGGIANTPGIQNPQAGDTVLVSITDINGREMFASGTLQSDMTWSIVDQDISELTFASIDDLTISPELRTTQEIPNLAKFNIGIFSPQGEKQILHMEYTKQVPQGVTGTVWDAEFQIWNYLEDYNPEITYDPAQYAIQNEKVYEILDAQTGVFEFASDGRMISETMPTLDNSGLVMDVTYGSGYNGLVSMNQGSVNTWYDQDGYEKGFLTDYGLDKNNQIIAEFTNGRTSAMSKVAVYHFQNDEGLEKLSGTYFRESNNSGDAIFYTDENGDFVEHSRIVSNMLENSNIMFSSAMSEMIILQRAYAANSKSITTVDQMLQKALQM